MKATQPGSIDAVIERFRASYASLVAADDERRHFHGVYMRNTIAVKEEIDRDGFRDPAWVERRDVVFAELYLDALAAWERGERPSEPWRVAFEATRDPGTDPFRHVLVGLNAHLNHDLPQALIAVVSDEEFRDPDVLARRKADVRHIDDILVARMREEDLVLRKEEPGRRTRVDLLVAPLYRAASRRFLTEARRKVWHNAIELSEARRRGTGALAARLRQLEELSTAQVRELLTPGKVLLRFGVKGYGVLLPPLGLTAAGNPAGWPAEVVPVFERFLVCEYATVTGSGRPMTYPLTPYIGEDGRTLDVSCELTSSAKAERARGNPAVTLLYSAAAGSGLDDPAVVLVYGKAAVRDRDLQCNTDRFIALSLAKLPAALRGAPRWLLRRYGWYWARIWIQVTPLRILWWPGGRLWEEPRWWEAPPGAEEVASDPPPGGPQPPPKRRAADDWTRRAVHAIRTMGPPVVTALDGDGYPVPFPANAVRLTADGFRLRLPAGRPIDPNGPACLTFRRHDPRLVGSANAVFVGRAEAAGEELVFRVERALPDVSLVGWRPRMARGLLANARRLRGVVRAEAARRDQRPPRVRFPAQD